MKKYQLITCSLCIVVISLYVAEGCALAGPPGSGGYYKKDFRYRSGRYYPKVGIRIDVLPPRYHTVRYHNSPYHYQGGVWYRSDGPSFMVVAPPIGLVAPVLPPAYTTVWYGGTPYYYCNNTYYVWQPARNGYIVVEPPEDITTKAPTVLSSELYVYPKLGQNLQQQSDDRFECHEWAVNETGYDPTQPSTSGSGNNRENYHRAIKACLDAKGYSVR